jgi:hypothetical protein
MGFLENLMGGGDDPRRQQAQDFISRYQQGSPYEGFSGDEALGHYQQVATQMPPETYQQSAQEAFANMSPQERVQFGQMLQQQARQQGVMDNAWDDDDNNYQDPSYLAQVTTRLQQQQPGLLGQLLSGGGGGGMLGGATNTGMGGVMGGGGSMGNMLSNPLAKAALGGIAAMAMRRMMSGR